MFKAFIIIGGVFGFLSVAFGAFGAHALKARLEADLLDIYQTGVQYQMFHAIALILTAVLIRQLPDVTVFNWAGWLFIAGIIIFSGSLYILSLSGIRIFGAITPIGGLAFLCGWVMLIIGAARNL